MGCVGGMDERKVKGLNKKYIYMYVCMYTSIHTHILMTHRHGQQSSMVIARGKGSWGGESEQKWVNWGPKETLLWAMNAQAFRWCFIDLYTWNLYGFVNQCHPNKFNKNICSIQMTEEKLPYQNNDSICYYRNSIFIHSLSMVYAL